MKNKKDSQVYTTQTSNVEIKTIDELYNEAFDLYYGNNGVTKNSGKAIQIINNLLKEGKKPRKSIDQYSLGLRLYHKEIISEDPMIDAAYYFYEAICNSKQEEFDEGSKERCKNARDGIKKIADECGREGAYAQTLYAKLLYEDNPHDKTAGDYFKEAADNGYNIAQWWMIECYMNGICGYNKSPKKALEYAEKAAKTIPRAMFLAGKLYYENGAQYEDAVYWLDQAIQKGVDEAEEYIRNIEPLSRRYDEYKKAEKRGKELSEIYSGVTEANAGIQYVKDKLDTMQLSLRALEESTLTITANINTVRDEYISGISELLNNQTQMLDTQNMILNQQTQQSDWLSQIFALQEKMDKKIAEGLDAYQKTIDEQAKNFPDDIKGRFEAELSKIFDSYWRNAQRLDELSCDRLVAARVLLYYSIKQDLRDYRGVVISATSALEYELYRRFYDGFIKYIDFKNFPNDERRYLNGIYKVVCKKGNKEELKLRDFTLGSLFYILKPGKPKTNKCMEIINDYLDDHIFSDTTKISSVKFAYPSQVFIGETKTDNPEIFWNMVNHMKELRDMAAHKEKIKKETAISCCIEIGIGAEEAMNTIQHVEGVLQTLMKLTKPFELIFDKEGQ